MVPDVAGNRHQGLVALAAGPYIFRNFCIFYNRTINVISKEVTMITIIDKHNEEFKEDVDRFIKLAKEAGYTDAEIRNVLAKAERDAE